MKQNTENQNKNILKYLSYKYAHEQIKRAIENGFFLEAITIEESIINDRLYPLYRKFSKNNMTLDRLTIGVITNMLKQMSVEDLSNLQIAFLNELDDFREKRNTCLHQIAKSEPGTAPMDISEFIKLSKTTAMAGKKLTGKISTWAEKYKPQLIEQKD